MQFRYDDGEMIDLKHLVKSSEDIVPNFNIVDQKWKTNRHLREFAKRGELDDYVNEFYPYNFLWLISGDGVIVIDADAMAVHAPLR
jgi:hypothetical protein